MYTMAKRNLKTNSYGQTQHEQFVSRTSLRLWSLSLRIETEALLTLNDMIWPLLQPIYLKPQVEGLTQVTIILGSKLVIQRKAQE